MNTTVSLPPLQRPGEHQSVVSLLQDRAATHPDHVAFLRQNGEIIEEVTTVQFLQMVYRLAASLIDRGIGPGQRVGIMAPSSFEWALTDYAVMASGASVVPIYETSSAQTAKDICAETGLKLVFAAAQCRERLAEAGIKPENICALETVDQIGQSAGIETVKARIAAVKSSDEATVVYTSGTTGQMRGAIITHRNLASQVMNVAAAYRQIVNDRGATLIFLPLAHVLARGLLAICVSEGMRVSFEADPKRAIGALQLVQPTFLVTPPRLLAKILEAVEQKVSKIGLGSAWARARRFATERGRLLEEADFRGEPPRFSFAQRAEMRLWQLLFFGAIHAKLGGNMECFLSGAAPLDAQLSWFFRGIGIAVVEGYGLTETTAPATGNRPHRTKSGTVGPPIPGMSIRIGDDGQVLLRGAGLFSGYLDGSGLDEDGYFATGDLGEIDEHGHLRIIGRTKNTLITAYGKNVSPEAWEARVETDPFVEAAIMIGEGRPFLSALVFVPPTPKPGAGEMSASGACQVVEDPRVVARIEKLVRAANAPGSRPEQVRRFTVLQMLDGDDLLTPTMKIRRSELLAECEQLIEKMYRR